MEYTETMKRHPDAEAVMKKLHALLLDISRLAGCTPTAVSESPKWTQISQNAVETRKNLHQHLKGKALYSALCGIYTEVLQELKGVLQSSVAPREAENTAPVPTTSNEEFREQRRRKRNSSDGQATKPKKPSAPATSANDPRLRRQEVPTRNFFAPLRSAEMETGEEAADDASENQEQQATPSVIGRPPPIVLTSEVNLIALQRQLKPLSKGNFEFRTTRNGTKVVTKEMADYSAIRAHFESRNLPHYTFYPKSLKPIKAVIRHLPSSTPAEDISDGLTELGYDVISVRQMTSTRRSPGEVTPALLPLFLITLPRKPKSQGIFQLKSLCYIAIKVEAYKAQNGLTQCYNCQKFGHVWANCRQPPRCLWCGGGHLHKECPEKENANSTPACCNCKLSEGEKPHPSTYRGCSHAKDEMRKRKPQSTPNTATGRVFSSKRTTTGLSFAAALRSNTGEQQRPLPTQTADAAPAAMQQTRAAPPPLQHRLQNAGQSVQAPSENSASLDNMFRVATVVQQIMTGLNGAVSEEDKIVAITKIVMKLMNSNGC
jgi:hypothetical protein